MFEHYTNELTEAFTELKGMRTWSVWKIEIKPYPEHSSKHPLANDGWNTPEKLLTFQEAYTQMERTPNTAIGLWLPKGGLRVPNTQDSYYIAIDLDGCRNAQNNWCGTEQQYKTYQLLRSTKSYMEISVSGTGFHCICIGKYRKGIAKSNRDEGIPEVYIENHSIILTGNLVDRMNLPITEGEECLQTIYSKVKTDVTNSNEPYTKKEVSQDTVLFNSSEPITEGRKTVLTSITGERVKLYIDNHFAWSDKQIADTVQAEIEAINAARCQPPLTHSELMDHCGIKSIQSFIDRDRENLRMFNPLMPNAEYYEPFYKMNVKQEAIGIYQAIIREYIANRIDYFYLGKRTEGKNATLYIYSDGHYKEDASSLLNRRIANCIPQTLQNASNIKGTKELFSMVSDKYIDDAALNKFPSKSCIPFKDCIYDLKTGQTYNNDPKYYEVNQLPWSYAEIQEAKPPVYFTQLMNEQIQDAEQRKNVYKFFAYCMTTDTRFQLILIFIGKGGTGKSTLLELLQNILGKNNYSTLSMQDMDPTNNASRFRTITLLHKMANICADISSRSITDTSVLKRLSGEDIIPVEDKGKSVINMRSYAKLVFSANTQPVQLDEPSDAWYRRFEVVQMNNHRKNDETFRQKLNAEIPSIIKVLLEYGKELYSEGIHQSQLSIDLLQENRENADSVASFITECVRTDTTDTTIKETAYKAYKDYCIDHGRKQCSDIVFYQRMRSNGIEETRRLATDGSRPRMYLMRMINTKYNY